MNKVLKNFKVLGIVSLFLFSTGLFGGNSIGNGITKVFYKVAFESNQNNFWNTPALVQLKEKLVNDLIACENKRIAALLNTDDPNEITNIKTDFRQREEALLQTCIGAVMGLKG